MDLVRICRSFPLLDLTDIAILQIQSESDSEIPNPKSEFPKSIRKTGNPQRYNLRFPIPNRNFGTGPRNSAAGVSKLNRMPSSLAILFKGHPNFNGHRRPGAGPCSANRENRNARAPGRHCPVPPSELGGSSTSASCHEISGDSGYLRV